MPINKSLLYKGSDYAVNDFIVVHHPTVGEIFDNDEYKFWVTVKHICTTASDIKHVLFDRFGKFYDKVDDFEAFRIVITNLPYEYSKILFPDLNFGKFVSGINENTNDFVLVNKNTKQVIDRLQYNLIVEFVRDMTSSKRTFDLPGNASTRRFLIDEAREESKLPPKEFKSTLLPKIEFMRDTGIPDYSFDKVWDIPVYVLFKDFDRNFTMMHKKMQVQGYLNNVYSNPDNLKKFDKKNFQFIGEPD
jgi:hypothetical protein